MCKKYFIINIFTYRYQNVVYCNGPRPKDIRLNCSVLIVVEMRSAQRPSAVLFEIRPENTKIIILHSPTQDSKWKTYNFKVLNWVNGPHLIKVNIIKIRVVLWEENDHFSVTFPEQLSCDPTQWLWTNWSAQRSEKIICATKLSTKTGY
jgi:hypothetical protein